MSTIYVRVSALVLATFLFGLVWSNDHKPIPKQKTVVAYDFEWPCQVEVLEPAIHAVSWQQIDDSVKRLSPEIQLNLEIINQTNDTTEDHSSPLVADRPEVIIVQSLTFPVPRNLSTGHFTVVDQFGKVSQINVTQEDLQSWGITTPDRSLMSYELTSKDGRWHFIRTFEHTSVAENREQPSREDVQAAWASVFEFAGEFMLPSAKQSADASVLKREQSVQISSEPAILN